MRQFFFFPVAALLLSACQQEQPAASEESAPESAAAEVYASGTRDRLCLKAGEQRAAVITFAATGNANCSVQGQMSGGGLIRPDGDEACQIAFKREGNGVAITQVGASCAYYCGPGASLEGKTFVRMDKPDQVSDLAGDPLC